MNGVRRMEYGSSSSSCVLSADDDEDDSGSGSAAGARTGDAVVNGRAVSSGVVSISTSSERSLRGESFNLGKGL